MQDLSLEAARQSLEDLPDSASAHAVQVRHWNGACLDALRVALAGEDKKAMVFWRSMMIEPIPQPATYTA